jgi:hypothetical protein
MKNLSAPLSETLWSSKWRPLVLKYEKTRYRKTNVSFSFRRSGGTYHFGGGDIFKLVTKSRTFRCGFLRSDTYRILLLRYHSEQGGIALC